MPDLPEYDYIVAGAGCAGLSLAMQILARPELEDKTILMVDRSPKTANDRTWCFWEQGTGFFEPVVHRSWGQLAFFGGGHAGVSEIGPYRYKMIRGIDFYHYCSERLSASPRVTMRFGEVERAVSSPGETYVVVDGERFPGKFLFNSIGAAGRSFGSDAFGAGRSSSGRGDPGGAGAFVSRGRWSLLQHFAGWTIETDTPRFDAGQATLMDFRVDQGHGAAFVYVLPLSERSALVEYTLFSERLLGEADYEAGLKDYIGRILKIRNYNVTEREFGVIPMTDHRFPLRQNDMLYIGTAGGRTKPSSGYTFQFIQKQSAAIAAALAATGRPFHAAEPRRFRYYDKVLLNVLGSGKLGGAGVFTELFRKNAMQDLFAFLDNESSFGQEWRIIRSLPTGPFLRAGIQELFRL